MNSCLASHAERAAMLLRKSRRKCSVPLPTMDQVQPALPFGGLQ
jgi:hypothetical protein